MNCCIKIYQFSTLLQNSSTYLLVILRWPFCIIVTSIQSTYSGYNIRNRIKNTQSRFDLMIKIEAMFAVNFVFITIEFVFH